MNAADFEVRPGVAVLPDDNVSLLSSSSGDQHNAISCSSRLYILGSDVRVMACSRRGVPQAWLVHTHDQNACDREHLERAMSKRLRELRDARTHG
jgi:hypothetical protein